MIDYVARVLKGINSAGSIAAYARAIGVSRTTVYGIINGSQPTRQTKAKINGYTRRTGYNPTNPASLPTKRAGISKASAKILFARAKAAGLRPRATVTYRVTNSRLSSIDRDVFYGNSLSGVDEAEAIARQAAIDVADQYGIIESDFDSIEVIYSVFW